MTRLITLKKRREFVSIARTSRSFGTPGFFLNTRPTPEADIAPDTIRIGYTVSKKVGNAVVRNRVKRRLRAAVHEVFLTDAKEKKDYVIVGRRNVVDISYEKLCQDMRFALSHIHKE